MPLRSAHLVSDIIDFFVLRQNSIRFRVFSLERDAPAEHLPCNVSCIPLCENGGLPAGCHIIGIAGCSGSGKSELALCLARRLGGAAILAADSYYRPLDHLPLQERQEVNFDVPQALEWELLLAHLEQLRSGEPVEEPVYDFARHTRAPECRLVEPRGCIIVEGLFTLYWDQVRRALDTKVFVKTAPAVCFQRRLARDVAERGRTPESVRAQYAKTVLPGAENYIWPTERFADVVVSGEQPVEDSVAAILIRLPAPHGPRPDYHG